jgi:uncharacterized protein (TIGR03437 family)
MLRPRTAFLIIPVSILVGLSLLSPQEGQSSSTLRRLTNTTDQSISLHPSFSNDGLNVVFESTADLAGVGGSNSFRALRANLATETATFHEIGRTRVISAGLSRDGSKLAFSSNEDLLDQNLDRNSEIYFFDGVALTQITHTSPAGGVSRLSDGNFQPSLSTDGQFIAFCSNRNLTGQNADFNFELFLYDTVAQNVTQLTNTIHTFGASDAKISGDGSRIAFIGRDAEADSQPDLKLYDMTTGNSEVIAAKVPELSLTTGRAISDDGSRVIYSSDYLSDGSSNHSQVFLFDSRQHTARQITTLGVRATDVDLQATISGDGKRVAFATRRKVVKSSDGSVELYVVDIPTAQTIQVTDAPSNATAEVVPSLNYDGSLVAFSFPRVLSGPTELSDMANNSEIYLASIGPRAAFGVATVVNAAARGNEPSIVKAIAPGSIASIRGNPLAYKTEQAKFSPRGSLPYTLAGTTVMVNSQQARILYVSPEEVTIVVPPNASIGLTEIVVTNADGFQLKAAATISPVAPGVFTLNGDGSGEGVILNADTLVAGPFDPTDGRLRLTIFATGVQNASHLSVSIAGQSATVETMLSSPDLPGLDEIHASIPAALRGSGMVTLAVNADGADSNPVGVTIAGSVLRDIMINEILADPPDGLAGDANHDGLRESGGDEFIELVNSTERDLDLSGYQLQTRSISSTSDTLRHSFAPGTILAAGTALVVFGGGTPDSTNPIFGSALVLKASTGSLSLINSGGVIILRDSSGSTISFLTYGTAVGLQADANQSLTRSPDISGNFLLHKVASGSEARAFSPGTRLDAMPFLPLPAVSVVTLSPAMQALVVGGGVQLTARAFDGNNTELTDVLFTWRSSAPSVVSIDTDGHVTAVGPGTAQVTAMARSVQSAPSQIIVTRPTPTPTPSPSPTPTPTPTPTSSPSPSPSSTPTPTPTPASSPSPSPGPSPVPATRLVISQIFGGGGNSGAPYRNDFIEIFNSGQSAVNLTGWSVQYAGATAQTWSVTNLTPVSLAPGEYYLIQESSGGSSGAALPTPDATGTIAMAATAGKVALVKTTTPLVGACNADPNIVDEVGYGNTANCFRGAGPTPSPSNTTAVLRLSNGCVDTQNNSADFTAVAPNPRNRLSTARPCSVDLAMPLGDAKALKPWQQFLSLCSDWLVLGARNRYWFFN